MKKVLIFSYAYFPLVGGAEVAVKEITGRISSEEMQFDMVTSRFKKTHPAHEKIGNVNVYRVSGGAYLFPFLACLKAGKLYRRNHYDVIWSIMANYAGFAALFFKMMHSKVPFLLTLQEGDPIDYIKHRVRFVMPLFRRIFTRADFIQAISNYLADFAREMGATCPLQVIPNGVNLKKFQTADFSAEDALRHSLNIRASERMVITVSRLVKKNGVADLIRATTSLPENTKLLVLGDGELAEELRALVSELDLGERVLFFGYISHEDMPDYLHISDVFCRPSLSEGMGNSFIEAMASDIPVVATNVGGIPDFLVDGETGLFCEAGNPASIAEKIGMLLEKPALREKIILNTRRLVEKYDWDVIAPQMQKVLNFR